MFAALGILLAVIWLFAFVTMKTVSAAFHLLLAFALISFIAHMFSGRNVVVGDRQTPVL